jgi:hypothetical protein
MACYDHKKGWQIYNSYGQIITLSSAMNYSDIPNYSSGAFLAESLDRNIITETNNAVPTASGTLFMQAIWLNAGITVNYIAWHSATTAAGTPTHWMLGLYSSSRALLATSADMLTTAWGANTIQRLPMTTPYAVTTSGLYYIGMFMAATSVITSKGGPAKTGGQLAATAPILHGATTDTGLTTSLPANAGTITGGLLPAWCAVM